VDHANEKHGAFIVAEFERIGAWRFGIAKALDVPLRVPGSCDEQSDAAGGQRVMMGGVRPATKEGDEDVNRKDDERGADKAFADGIEVMGKSQVQKDDRSSQHGDCERVA
jgi:hypothetical protein